jgi:hypothetical protein
MQGVTGYEFRARAHLWWFARKDVVLRSLFDLATKMEQRGRVGDVGAGHCALALHALNECAQVGDVESLAAMAKAVRGDVIGKVPSDPKSPMPLVLATGIRGEGQQEDVYALLRGHAAASIAADETIEKNIGRLVSLGAQYIVSSGPIGRAARHEKIDEVLQLGRLGEKRRKDPAAIASAVMRVLTGHDRQWGGRTRQAASRQRRSK